MFDSRPLETFDPALAAALRGELDRQERHIELIASENYVSPRVLAAQGSVLTNKYADGYPGHRHYAGCEHADVAESLAIERARASSIPPRGPRSVLCVVVVTRSASSTGFG